MFNWLSFLAGVLYIVLGIFVMLKHWLFTNLEPMIAYSLAAILVLYGGFRIIRAVQKIKQSKNEN